VTNPFNFQNQYGGFAFTGYGSNPALTAARAAAFQEQEAEKERMRLRQKEEEKLRLEEIETKESKQKEESLARARVPAKYRDGQGRPFSDVTIANIESGVYRDPSLPLPKRRMFEFFNKQDDPEDWAKKVSETEERSMRYREQGMMANREMREREEGLRMATIAGRAGIPSQGGGGGGGGAPQMTMPSISLEEINLGQEMQQYNLGKQRTEFEKRKQLDQYPWMAGREEQDMRSKQQSEQAMQSLSRVGLQPTIPSMSTGFQPTNFQPQMDALRQGIMGRMAGKLGVQLPQMGQPFRPQYTPYWQQAGMNPPKFPRY
jgi:hypothetical protein